MNGEAGSTWVYAYLAGALAMFAWAAYLDRHSARETFWCSLLWPLVLLAVVLVDAVDWLERRGWYLEVLVRRDLTPFGFRRRPTGRGWAVRCLYLELQAWRHA